MTTRGKFVWGKTDDGMWKAQTTPKTQRQGDKDDGYVVVCGKPSQQRVLFLVV